MTSGLLQEQELKKEGFLKTRIKERLLAIKAAQDLLSKIMLILRYRFDYYGNSNTRYASCFDRVYVATEIGATNAFARFASSVFQFFWNVNCSSLFNQEDIKKVLIGADKMSSIVDYTDRSTCIIFGDGAGAVLFEPIMKD
jgi:3-oxoacyl-[acyl-carrier-protein] synthase-3